MWFFQNAVNFFKQYGFEGEVHLAMALLAANIDVVWYTFDENSGKLLLTPAFKKFCPSRSAMFVSASASCIKTVRANANVESFV